MARLTQRVTRDFDPAKLHKELAAAGINVVTVRASHPEIGGPAFYGVVVFDGVDPTDRAVVNTTITAHVEDRVPSRRPTVAERNAALAEMEKL